MRFLPSKSLVIAMVLVLAGSASPCWGDDSPAVADPLRDRLAPNEANIWYLLHCGFAVKTATKFLIFDYIHEHPRTAGDSSAATLSNGRINPAEIADLDVYVFVTHPHADHFDQTIFGWRDSMPSIHYFFGWEASDNPKDHNLIGPRATYADDNIAIYTINSHHSGVPEVAYLVKTDSLVIYHAGDYNQDYQADIPYLKQYANRVDIAMLNDWCGGPIAAVLEQLAPSLVFPQHFGGDEPGPGKIAECVREQNLPIRVEAATRRGELFHYVRTEETL